MKRRNLLVLFSLSAIIPGLTSSWLYRGGSASSDKEIEGKLLKLFSEMKSPKVIGAEYLRSFPGQVDSKVLLARICSSCEGGARSLTQMDARALREWIHERQRKDFEEGRIIKLQGWILSATEVQLCALATLHS